MNYAKGQNVLVTDYEGEKFKRRVWRDQGATVLITSGDVFALLENGQTALWPIPVPKASVSAIGRTRRR